MTNNQNENKKSYIKDEKSFWTIVLGKALILFIVFVSIIILFDCCKELYNYYSNNNNTNQEDSISYNEEFKTDAAEIAERTK